MLIPLCCPFATSMIDPLETTANSLDSGRHDEAEIICGTVLRTKPDDSLALCLMGRDANAYKVGARALDDLARVENPELAQLYVDTAIVHGFGAHGAAVRITQQAVLLAPDAPNDYQTFDASRAADELKRVHHRNSALWPLRRDTTRSQLDAPGRRVRGNREEIDPTNL
jgi:hypothetical protein